MYRMWITDRNNKLKGYDVSELVHDIEYTTSLYDQAGKLTFSLEKDPNGILRLENGQQVRFWNGNYGVFSGYIFKISTNRSEKYSVTAYDKLRYFQNHDFRTIGEGEKTIVDVFKEICTRLGFDDYKITGYAAENGATLMKLHKHNWNDVSYFEMLKDCLDEMNRRSIADTKMDASGTVIDSYSNILDKDAKKYFIRDNFGVIELTDIEYITNGWTSDNLTAAAEAGSVEWKKDMNGETVGVTAKIAPLIIGDKSLLTDYTYEISIDNSTYNEIIYVESGDKEKTEKAQSKDAESNEIVRADWRKHIQEGSANDAEVLHAYDLYLQGLYPGCGEKTKAQAQQILAQQAAKNPNKENEKVSDNVYPCIAQSRDEESIKKYGLLRLVKTVNAGATKEQLDEYTKLALYEYNNVGKSLKIEALGFDGMNAGNGFLFELRKLGIYDKNEDYGTTSDDLRDDELDYRIMMYIMSATHHYGDSIHTMSLDVMRPDMMTEVLR